MESVKGYIFDLDGTLVDSALDFDMLREKLGFPKGVPVLEHVDKLPDPESRSVALEKIYQFELDGARKATWMPGADRLISELRHQGIPTGILTRNMREAVALTQEKLGLDVDIVLTREDCAPKPDPEGLQKIAEQWSLSAAQCVYIGDFLFDLQAARNAGMYSWFYAGQKRPHYAEEADRVICHFDEIHTELRQRLM
ncbi:HAD family hydrolase [Hahella ganghwensis]|uniref:HAD family hydrolase n=1 Tax=Hahella ganghwensis TaxID=286420 RepID=UPI000374EC6A|nr:HAD family hydrolase [Hahella ganghwensis]